MKKLILSFALAAGCAAAACADQGCIETSSVTVTATICSQFDCIQRSGGNCVNWACTRTQTSKYLDAAATGCTRLANCGRAALFYSGAPQEADTDSTEQCDWYPCVEADAQTGACLSYMCVSKRVTQIVRATYPDARCVPLPPELLPKPQEKKAQPQKQQAPAPKAVPARRP